VSFLQTGKWLSFQKSLGRRVFRYEKDGIEANIIRHDLPFRKNYLYIPHGPSGVTQNFIQYLKNLAAEEKSFYVKAEPRDDFVAQLLCQFGFKKSKKELQPSKTVVIDLTKSEEELLGRMHHKTRYNIKVAEKHDFKLVFRKDTDGFWKLLKHTAKNDNFSTHEKSYYEKLCTMPGMNAETVFVEHDGVPIAGAIWLAHGDTAYYLHGGMDRNPKYKPMMAPYYLHWELIKVAKKYGLNNYDFWGIDAKRYPGVTRFKLNWGGQTIEYPGSFDLPVSKFWYLVYKLLRNNK